MSHPLLHAYAALGEALEGVRKAMDEHSHTVGDSELLALLRTHHRAEARLDAFALDLVSHVDLRDLAHRCGASSLSAWLSGILKLSPHAAADRVRTAQRKRDLTLRDNHDGTQTVRWGVSLPPDTGLYQKNCSSDVERSLAWASTRNTHPNIETRPFVS